MVLKAPYLLALCDAAQESDMTFGLARRLGTQSSTFDLQATKVIHSLVTFSPASESLAIEFLNEFQKVPALDHLGSISLLFEYLPLVDDGITVASVLSGEAGADVHQWAQDATGALHDVLNVHQQQLSTALKPVLDLASEYLTHVLIAVRNPGGKKTPQVSACPTPGVLHTLADITTLIERAVIDRNHAALKKLIYLRDGYICPFSDTSFDPQGAVFPSVSYSAHILPFSLHNKPVSLQKLESFTGRQFSAADILAGINHPRNAINLQGDTHSLFDGLHWGIEATTGDNNEIIYQYRNVASAALQHIRRSDGDRIFFDGGTNGNMINGPDPRYCNLRLAISRVLHACGAADIIAKMYLDDDDDVFITQPSYFGGPFVPDEVLCRRLDDRLSPYV